MDINSIKCVITGISGETSGALATHLLEGGATIIGTTRPKNTTRKLEQISAHEFRIAMDPLKLESVQQALDLMVDRLQGVQVWINVVGGFEMGKNIEDSSIQSWNQMWMLNFESVLNASRVILPHFKKMQSGRLINFGAAAAETGMAQAAPYLVSKAAVHSLTRVCAAEVSGDITCNALLPSTIDTSNNRQAMPQADFSSWVTTETIAEEVLQLIKGSANGKLIRL